MSWLCFPSAWPSSQSSHQYFAFKIWNRTSKLVSVKLRAPKIKIYQILGFAGVLRVILGAVIMCIYMRWCSGYRMAWYVPGRQPGCKPCWVIFKMSIVVIVWPLGSKTRQTSRIRRDSENWVILGHTPKLPKISQNNWSKECSGIIMISDPWCSFTSEISGCCCFSPSLAPVSTFAVRRCSVWCTSSRAIRRKRRGSRWATRNETAEPQWWWRDPEKCVENVGNL